MMSGRRFSKTSWVVLMAMIISVVAGCETRESLTRKRIKEVEKSLLRAVYLKGQKQEKLSLNKRMEFYRVPAVSLALMDRYSIEWSRSYGIKDRKSNETATLETLFQAGAASQAVAAAALLKLVAAAKLSLADDAGKILADLPLPWTFETGAEKIPLFNLLLNTAGFTEKGLDEFARKGKRPILRDFLIDQLEKYPGLFSPSSGSKDSLKMSEPASLLVEEIIERTAKVPYPEFVIGEILRPLGLNKSTFDSLLLESKNDDIATGHSRNGQSLPEKWFFHPSAAASGLWTNPQEMLLLVEDLLKSAMGKEGKLLPPDLARFMLSEAARGRSAGFIVQGSGTDVRLNIRGRTSGFTCALELYPYRGQAAVVMTNSDNGFLLTEEIMRAISAVYGWPDFKPQEKTLFRLDPSIYQQYVGRYEISPDYQLDVSFEDYYLVVKPTGQAPTKFYVESQSFFFSVDPFIRIQFLFDRNGGVVGLNLWQEDFKLEARKVF